jgi:protein O-mannosyl-transferase
LDTLFESRRAGLTPQGTSALPGYLPPLLIALAVLASQGVALWGGFVWDDRPLIVENRLIKDPAEVGTIFTSGFWQAGDRHDRFRSFFRPLVTLTYALDYAVWGLRPFGFHLTNLVLHFLCAFLVFRLALSEGLTQTSALAGAVLFAVHPAHVESVAWISGRTDLLCGVFVLCAFLLRRRRRRLSLACFALGLLSKEVAAVLPLLLFGDRWISDPLRRGRLSRSLAAAAPYLGVLILYLGARRLALGSGTDPLYHLDPEAWIATVLFVLARYTTLLLLPVRLDPHYPYAARQGLIDPVVVLSALIVLPVLCAGIALWRRRSRTAFWLGWIIVGLLPVILSFGSFGDILLADRFLYIPSVGFVLLAARASGAILGRLDSVRGKRLAAATAVLAVVALAGQSFAAARVWKDDVTLFSRLVLTSPDSAMVHCNLGLALYDRGDYETAKKEFSESIRLEPGYSLAHNDLAAAYEREGRFREALAHYSEALRIVPDQLESQVNVGNLLVRLGRTEEGLAVLKEVLRQAPSYPQGLYAFADAADRTGQKAEALASLRKAEAIDPFYPYPHYLLGKILFEEGRYSEAADEMRRFLHLWQQPGPHRDAALQVIARGEALNGKAAPFSARPPSPQPAAPPEVEAAPIPRPR